MSSLTSSLNPITARGPKPIHEASGLRPLRDADSVGRQWLKNQNTTSQLFAVMHNINELQRQMDRLRLMLPQPQESGWNYPFKVHRSPGSTSMTAGSEWLYFRMDRGLLGRETVTNTCISSTAFGLNSTDFLIDVDTFWWAYVDYKNFTSGGNLVPTVQFKNTANLPWAPVDDDTNWWKGEYVLVATLDADAGTKVVTVTQYRHDNIPLAPFCVDGELTYQPV